MRMRFSQGIVGWREVQSDYASFERTQASENTVEYVDSTSGGHNTIIIITTDLAPGFSAVNTDIVLSGDIDIESQSIATCRGTKFS